MTDRTPKENFLDIINGKLPESIPFYNMGIPLHHGEACVRSVGARIFNDTHMSPNGGQDIWGVRYVANEETNFASIPEPDNFLIEDITKWRDIIKAPEMPSVDWETLAKNTYEKAMIDRSRCAVMSGGGFMPFQQLVSFMGFTGALCALYEEPDEVKELLNYITDFYMPVINNTLDYFKPDFFYMLDDTASKYNPFFSHDMYVDIFKPIYTRLATPAMERGIPIGFHNCGRCEEMIDDMLDFGVKFWDPVQTSNDLLGIQKKYKGKLTMCGCLEVDMFPNWPDVTEEEFRQKIRDTIDTLAPGGGFVPFGMILGAAGDERCKRFEEILQDESLEYGYHYYERH